MYYLTRKNKGSFSLSLYSGEKNKNKRQGFGLQLFPNGCCYLGEWNENQAEGKGIFILKDGTSYKGEFKKNFIVEGEIDYFNGAQFKGKFDGTPFERFKNGTFYFKCGMKYTGEWNDGLPKQGYLFDRNKKVGELPRDHILSYQPNMNGVLISSENKWIYEGGMEFNECTGKGIVYCTFQQYKMGDFKNNKSHGKYYKMSINWGEFCEGRCEMDKKVGKIVKMLNNGYEVEYEIGESKAVVTFPFLNSDKFEGIVIFEKTNFNINFKKGVYYFNSQDKTTSIDIYNIDDIYSIKEVQDRGIDFDFTLSKFLQNTNIEKKLKDFLTECIKNNLKINFELLPDFLNFNKNEAKSSNKNLTQSEMDKFIRAKYMSEMKKQNFRSKSPILNKKKQPPPKLFEKRKTHEYDENRSIFPGQSENDSLKARGSSRKNSLKQIKNYESSKIEKSKKIIRKSGSVYKKTSNNGSSFNLNTSELSSSITNNYNSNFNNKSEDLKESIVVTKKSKKQFIKQQLQISYVPSDFKNKEWKITEEGIDFFEGKILDGLKQGEGRIVYLNGTILEGYFKNNVLEKKGKIIFPNGIIYHGSFHNNNLEGDGEIELGRYKIKGRFNNNKFENELLWINKQNLHFLFKDSLHKEMKTGDVTIYFNNNYKIKTKINDGVIQEGFCVLEDAFCNYWDGFIKKKNNLFIFRSNKLNHNYFVLDFYKGVLEVNTL